MIRICKNCLKEFEHKGNTRGIFCSMNCYWNHRRTSDSEYRKAIYVTLTCAHCGKQFERRYQQVKQRPNNRAFCSSACAGIATYTRKRVTYRSSTTINCQECNTEFRVTATEIKNGRKHCSRECAFKARSKMIVGEHNPNYRHGTNQGAAKNIAKKHYPMQCVVCNFDVVVEIHHILPKSKGGTNHPDNLAVLCPNHHAMAERNLIDAKDLLEFAQKAKFPSIHITRTNSPGQLCA